jgi:hypothetical protein
MEQRKQSFPSILKTVSYTRFFREKNVSLLPYLWDILEVGNRHSENLISKELIERITFLCSLQ